MDILITKTIKPRSLDAVMLLCETQLGYTEVPAGSNRTKYGSFYGLNEVPWCMEFVWWVLVNAGYSGFFKTASCSSLLDRYLKYAPEQVIRNGKYKAGDILLYDFTGNRRITEHCGILKYTSDAGSTLHVYEGNTSYGDNCNGGIVQLRTRSTQQVTAAIRPNY